MKAERGVQMLGGRHARRDGVEAHAPIADLRAPPRRSLQRARGRRRSRRSPARPTGASSRTRRARAGAARRSRPPRRPLWRPAAGPQAAHSSRAARRARARTPESTGPPRASRHRRGTAAAPRKSSGVRGFDAARTRTAGRQPWRDHASYEMRHTNPRTVSAPARCAPAGRPSMLSIIFARRVGESGPHEFQILTARPFKSAISFLHTAAGSN